MRFLLLLSLVLQLNISEYNINNPQKNHAQKNNGAFGGGVIKTSRWTQSTVDIATKNPNKTIEIVEKVSTQLIKMQHFIY